jgi:hypothetical protein
MSDDKTTGPKGLSRRAFLKRMAAVGFAVPVVTSFALDGVASSTDDWSRSRFGNQSFSNQRFGNQTFGNQPGTPNPNHPNSEFPSHPFPSHP